MAKILVADDNDQIRNMLVVVLEEAGYEVFTASNGIDAEKLFRERKPDLVITDIVMPDQEGVKTILDIRRLDPAARIIAMSGGSEHLTGDDCLRSLRVLAKGVLVFQKPLDLMALLKTVKELIG